MRLDPTRLDNNQILWVHNAYATYQQPLSDNHFAVKSPRKKSWLYPHYQKESVDHSGDYTIRSSNTHAKEWKENFPQMLVEKAFPWLPNDPDLVWEPVCPKVRHKH